MGQHVRDKPPKRFLDDEAHRQVDAGSRQRKHREHLFNLGIFAERPSPYGTTKAGELEFTWHTAAEWSPRGIRANAVSPSFIMAALSKGNYASEEMIARRVQSVPSRNLGSLEDIAKAVTFLASDGVAFIIGDELAVDSGFLDTTLMHVQPAAEQFGGWKPSSSD